MCCFEREHCLVRSHSLVSWPRNMSVAKCDAFCCRNSNPKTTKLQLDRSYVNFFKGTKFVPQCVHNAFAIVYA